jgi:hypothetical protein
MTSSDREHERRSARRRARATWRSEWTENGRRYLPLQDGQQDPRLLLVPLGEVRREARRLEPRRRSRRLDATSDRDRLPPGPRVRPRRDGARGSRHARLLHRPRSARTSTTRCGSSSFRGTSMFAQSFPNTIPWSESIGFIARVDDSKPDDIDYPFYGPAHELSHQWWAHQVIGGNVQGGDAARRDARASTRRSW